MIICNSDLSYLYREASCVLSNILLYNPHMRLSNTTIQSFDQQIIFSYNWKKTLYMLQRTSCQKTGTSAQSGTCNGEGTGDDLADILMLIE
jgi:hypothetical protein